MLTNSVLRRTVTEVKLLQCFYMPSLTFLASTFLYPFGISDVVVAGFTVKQRSVEEKQESCVRQHPTCCKKVLQLAFNQSETELLVECYAAAEKY